MKYISFWIPHCTPSVIQQHLLSENVITKIPNELFYIEEPSTSKDVQQQLEGNFDLQVDEGNVLPLFIMVGFQQKNDYTITSEKLMFLINRHYFLPNVSM